MSTPLATSWYAVQTHPRAEQKASQHLLFQGYQVYLPRYLKRRRHARKVDIVAAPLFPRYLFVAVDIAAQRWRSIRSTFGVSQLVCVGDRPVAVPQSIIDGLRSREGADGWIELPKSAFVPGEKVRVMDGVFSDCLGLYEGMADSARVAVLLDLLGRKVRVIMAIDAVTAA